MTHTFVILHYGIFAASTQTLESLGVKLLALATWRDVVAVAEQEKFFDAAQLAAIKSYIDNPETWQPAT